MGSLLTNFCNVKPIVRYHNQETDTDTILSSYSDFLHFICIRLLVRMCLFLCTKVTYFFLRFSFQPKGHWTSCVFLLLEWKIQISATEIRIHLGVCCFLWYCENVPYHSRKGNQQVQKTNDSLGVFSVLVFYFKILYVKRAGFSLIFCPTPIPTSSLSIFSFCLFLIDKLKVAFGKS